MSVVNAFKRKHPPRFVTILGHRIKVRVVPFLEDSGSELLGAFNAETKEIFLLKGCDWRSVLAHECCHAVFYLSGAGEGLSYSKEENLVLALEHGLVPLFLL